MRNHEPRIEVDVEDVDEERWADLCDLGQDRVVLNELEDVDRESAVSIWVA
jgi:hypothetical protein